MRNLKNDVCQSYALKPFENHKQLQLVYFVSDKYVYDFNILV